MEINSIFHEVVNSEVPVPPGGWSKKRGKGKPRVSADSIRVQIVLTVSAEVWADFVKMCKTQETKQAEVVRGLITGWVEKERQA